MNIGYVGMGQMGSRLSRHLLREHALFVFDRDPAAMERMRTLGATPCADAAELAGRAEVIGLCLPTSDHVHDVLFGAKGLAQSARPGTLFIDQTTGDPAKTRAMDAELQKLGMNLVDAPISGGPAGADAGTVCIMVGATPELFERAAAVLRVISPNVFHAGAPGTGHVAKLANNLISAAHRVVTLEALALASKNGIEPAKMVDILLASSGRNFFIETFVRKSIISGKLATGFTINLMHKDVKLASQLGVESGVPMFCTSAVREFFQVAANMMGRETEVNSVAVVMDRLAGSHIVPENYTLT